MAKKISDKAASPSAQASAQARAILDRRAGKKLGESKGFKVPESMTPKAQHDKRVIEIMKRRGVTVDETVADVDVDLDIGDAAEQDLPVPDPIPDNIETVTDYSGWHKKDLKKHCDSLGITYHKKATNDTLIALIQGA